MRYYRNRDILLSSRGDVFLPGTPGLTSSSDRWKWPDDFESYCIFDWIADDGTTPRVGTITNTFGAPALSDSPIGRNSMYFNGSSGYRTGQTIIPDPTEDLIVVSYFGIAPGIGADYPEVWGTTGNSISERGLRHYAYKTTWAIYCRLNGDTVAYTSSTTTYPIWALGISVINRSGNVLSSYYNGLATTPASLPAGTWGDKPLSIACDSDLTPSASFWLTGYVARIQAFRGVGIGSLVTDEYARYHAAVALGYGCKSRSKYFFSTRTGVVRCKDRFCGSQAPVNSTGVAAWGALTNKCYKNVWILAGEESILSADVGIVKTTTASVAHGIKDVGDRVFNISNPTGGPLRVWYGATTTATTQVALSVRASVLAGTATLGLAGASFTSGTAVLTGWARTQVVVTATETSAWSIELAALSQVQFLLGNHVVSNKNVPEVWNLATAATATKNAEVITLAGANLDAFVELDVAPDDWAGGDDGRDLRLIERATIPGDYARIDDGVARRLYVSDGTQDAGVAIVESAGVVQRVRTSWSAGQLKAKIGLTVDTDVFDGDMGGSGDLRISCSDRLISRIKV